MTTDVLMPVLQRVGITLGGAPAIESNFFPSQAPNSLLQMRDESSLQVRSCRAEGTEAQPTLQVMQYVPSAVEQAVTSVVLITIGDGAWASGIILNKTGLILTNAHLLEPWRFGKTKLAQSPVRGMTSSVHEVTDGTHYCSLKCRQDSEINSSLCNNKTANCSFCSFSSSGNGSVVAESALSVDVAQKNYQRIRVRLDHCQPRSWHTARPIYVSQGPLDIALLQLESPPQGLCPIIPEKECPIPGSAAVVLGHGLFGPRSGTLFLKAQCTRIRL